MTTSLKVRHLPRYTNIAALLMKHARADETATEQDARQLVDELESMGPTFVKLGQLLSTRADLLPPVYLDALARLQDDVAPVAFAEIETIVAAEIGAIDGNPVGTREAPGVDCNAIGHDDSGPDQHVAE